MVRYDVNKLITLNLNISFELGPGVSAESVVAAVADAEIESSITILSDVTKSLRSEECAIGNQASDELNLEKTPQNLLEVQPDKIVAAEFKIKIESKTDANLKVEVEKKDAKSQIGTENYEKIIGHQPELCNKPLSSSNPGISAQCMKLFEDLKIRRAHRYIILRIGDSAIEVETVGTRDETFKDLTKKLPFTECRYCVYDQDVLTADKRRTSKLWLISWFPLNSTPYSKMAYTTSKKLVTGIYTGVFDILCTSVHELEQNLGLNQEEEEDQEFDF